MSYNILNPVKYWNQDKKYPYKLLNFAPKNILGKYQYHIKMALSYLGLKIWSHKTLNNLPPFQTGNGNQKEPSVKKNSHEEYENQRGSKLDCHNNSKSLYNMMWKSEGAGDYILQPDRILKSDRGLKHFSYNILKSWEIEIA